MKRLLPQVIKQEIEKKCPLHRNRDYFVVGDLLEPLQKFIDTELQLHDSRLYQYYRFYKGLSEKTLRLAWRDEGEKDDGAEEKLRDLLCYFGFKKSWRNTLSELKIDDEEVLQWTNSNKSKMLQSNSPEPHFLTEENKIIKNSLQKIYVELTTRKAALPFDEDHDVIVEIYDSWYKLFGIIREEMKSFPVSCFFEDNRFYPILILTRRIINDGLRIHLTQHQAKFRKWITIEKMKPANNETSPQELQKKYPNYEALFTSMKAVSNELASYSQELLIQIKKLRT